MRVILQLESCWGRDMNKLLEQSIMLVGLLMKRRRTITTRKIKIRDGQFGL